MAIVIVPTNYFENLPPKHQKVAEDYLFGKEFDSLSDALNQEFTVPGGEVELPAQVDSVRNYFKYAETMVRPLNLPATIIEAGIVSEVFYRWDETSYKITGLRARLKEISKTD